LGVPLKMTVYTINPQRRFAVRQVVNLRKSEGRAARGLLIELSSEGCRISNLKRGEHATGDAVTVEMGEVTLPGVIRWAHDGVAGVKLSTALFSNQLTELVAIGRGENEVARYGT